MPSQTKTVAATADQRHHSPSPPRTPRGPSNHSAASSETHARAWDARRRAHQHQFVDTSIASRGRSVGGSCIMTASHNLAGSGAPPGAVGCAECRSVRDVVAPIRLKPYHPSPPACDSGRSAASLLPPSRNRPEFHCFAAAWFTRMSANSTNSPEY